MLTSARDSIARQAPRAHVHAPTAASTALSRSIRPSALRSSTRPLRHPRVNAWIALRLHPAFLLPRRRPGPPTWSRRSRWHALTSTRRSCDRSPAYPRFSASPVAVRRDERPPPSRLTSASHARASSWPPSADPCPATALPLEPRKCPHHGRRRPLVPTVAVPTRALVPADAEHPRPTPHHRGASPSPPALFVEHLRRSRSGGAPRRGACPEFRPPDARPRRRPGHGRSSRSRRTSSTSARSLLHDPTSSISLPALLPPSTPPRLSLCPPSPARHRRDAASPASRPPARPPAPRSPPGRTHRNHDGGRGRLRPAAAPPPATTSRPALHSPPSTLPPDTNAHTTDRATTHHPAQQRAGHPTRPTTSRTNQQRTDAPPSSSTDPS